jgi:hypothetical protein
MTSFYLSEFCPYFKLKEQVMRGNCKSSCRSKCACFCGWLIVAVAVGGAAVMLLWNWLTPVLFGWKTINFLQALGLLVLSRILFGGFRGRGGHGGRHHLAERLEAMTPEEREKFKAGMKSKWWCCSSSSASDSTSASEPADKQ